jgi:ABC-type sugar transport system ATPase subunit
MQRVSIGRALAKEAKIVLFDEIFVNLDYKLREEMRVEFKGLVDRLNITTVFSTPDPEDALSLASKTAIVHDGRIVQYDTTEKVYRYPVDLFTGSYFGYPEMNLIDCAIVKKDKEFYIDADSFKIPINGQGRKKMPATGRYVLGIRPENISIGEREKPQRRIVLQGKMLITEVIGSDTIVHIEVGKHVIESFVPGIYRSASEKELWVGFDPENIYLFNKETSALETRGV